MFENQQGAVLKPEILPATQPHRLERFELAKLSEWRLKKEITKLCNQNKRRSTR